MWPAQRARPSCLRHFCKVVKKKRSDVVQAMLMFDGLQSHFDRGNSWMLIVVIFIVSTVLCLYCSLNDQNIVAQWSFEPIIEVPKKLRNHPVVRDLFAALRGFNYDVKLPNKMDYLKGVQADTGVSNRSLISGFGFFHFLQHFAIAFFCPKLIFVSFIFSVGWELFESSINVHCTFDILWNLIGMLVGLLCRATFCPISSEGI